MASFYLDVPAASGPSMVGADFGARLPGGLVSFAAGKGRTRFTPEAGHDALPEVSVLYRQRADGTPRKLQPS